MTPSNAEQKLTENNLRAEDASPRHFMKQRLLSSMAATQVAPSTRLASSKWNVLLEAYPGQTDYMSTASYSEYKQFGGLGQSFYVPANSGDFASKPLYRLYNGVNDHMASTTAGEGGYNTEGVLGYPLTSQNALAGLTQIHRLLKAPDHATAAQGTGITGYTDEGGLGVYGYMRYRTNPTQTQAVSGGGITALSDLIAGGSVIAWTWNGIQMIDNHDYGRNLQADIFFTDGGESSGHVYNPIEAGDDFFSTSDINLYRHGSPCALASVSGNVQQTRAIPLDYWGDQIDTDINSVRVYHGCQIGKDLTLGWNGMNGVAHYVTHFIMSSQITAFDSEVPTAYLTGDFNALFTFDVKANTITQVTVNSCAVPQQELRWTPTSGYGGVILSRPDKSAAQGVYAVMASAGTGSKSTSFTLDDFSSCQQTTKWAVRAENVTLVQGDNTFSAYIVTGTYNDVVSLMRQLYSMNVS